MCSVVEVGKETEIDVNMGDMKMDMYVTGGEVQNDGTGRED